ncbi:MAG: 7-carboxy-7-deazaguanine synthase [Phycisphaerales bacterium]|jgi:7-carboxy-7-deazaguanine synthase
MLRHRSPSSGRSAATFSPKGEKERRPSALPSAVLICETFTSIQGEGSLTGVPSWFCRLSGCNLRCTWCDTPYASWNPEGEQRSVEELVAEAKASGVRHAVLTGGEPMIFKELVPLSAQLREMGMHVTIETAGTVWLEALHADLISISPKLANSTPVDDPRDTGGKWSLLHEERRLNLPVLARLLGAFPERQLKFVVASPSDLPEIDALLADLSAQSPPLSPPLRPAEVFLMPEGVTVPSPESVRWVVDECTRRGWRYAHRLHIELFGDTRGT